MSKKQERVQASVHETTRLLAIKHGLTIAEVVTVTERLFTTALEKWYGHDVVAILDEEEGLTANSYKNSHGIILQHNIEPLMLKRFMTGKTPRTLSLALEKFKVAKESAAYQRHKNEIRWGEVIGFEPDGTIRVEIEIEPNEKIIAFCPRNRLGVHERHLIRTSQRRAWHLRMVEPVLINGTPRVKVTVDRVSKHLTTGLLRELFPGINGINCVKRYVGRKSFVVTPVLLPKKAIMAVKEELNEHLQINISKPAAPSRLRTLRDACPPYP